MASYGSLTVDGALGDWTASDRLDNSLNAIAGVEAYGRRVASTYVFAFKHTDVIGAGTTIWLNTDMNRASGFKVFGFAAGAEYAISVDAAGVATLVRYTAGGALDAAFVPVVLDKALSADGKTVEFAVPATSLGNITGPVEAYVLVNNATATPLDYSGVAYTVRAGTDAQTVGAVTLDGALTDWTALHSLETAANTSANFDIYGRVEANSFVLAVKANTAVGPGTTIWINTDQDPLTGYRVFGTDGGAEYAIEFDLAGNPALYSVNATSGVLTLVGAVQASFSADRTIVELAFAKTAIASPVEINLFADINNVGFAPDSFALPQYEVRDISQLPVRTDLTKKVAIVYSETSANKFFNKTAYGQLFMNAQSQAQAAGVAYDVISENDLKDISKLVNYDAIVFPSFGNVKAADVQAIANTLELAVEHYKIGLIAAGNFMTSDENGVALPGNSYARLEALMGVTREAGGTAATGITLNAGDVTHTMMEGYTANELIRSYGAQGWADFRATGAGVTTVKQTVDGTVYDGAIATTTGGRNVHFASEAVSGDSNLLQNAIEWSVYGAGVRVGLQVSRFNSVTASRTDLDSSSMREDVAPTGQPGIYDVLMPILQQWKDTFNFVGSYYANIGDPNITNGSTPQSTNWAQSLNYYKAMILMGNEVGSHSTTHLLSLTPSEDTNILTTGTGPGSFDYEFRLSRDILTQQISSVISGYRATGAAVPGAPEQVATSLNILQYYDYISGGWSGVGGGYPGAFGYLTPEQQSKVYIAPNVKFDFTLVQFQGMTLAQAQAAWAAEVASISSHSDLPIIVWPWHDYGATAWLTPGETGPSPYATSLFTNFIAAAYNSGTEFVTLADLAKRIASQEKAGVAFTQTGDTINATVTSSDAGKFALDLDGLGTKKIASVTGWYAYDEDSVFTDRDGGAFTINLGAAVEDITHITALPMRAELLSVSGNGTNLAFSVIGEGKVVIDLKNVAGATLTVTGATIVSRVGDILTLDIGNSTENLIVNGSFELGTLSAVNNTVQYPTNGQLTGWTNGAATSIEVWRNFGGVVATNGNYLVELDNAAAVDTLYQNVQTTNGALYTLSVDLRARVGNTDTVEVWWAGQRIATVNPSATAWTTYTYVVTGTGGSDRLEFRETAAQNNGSGALIDNVRLLGAGGQQHSVTVTLGAPPANQPPVITSNGGGATAAIALAENLLAVTTVLATNPEAGQTITYSIAGGADAAKFTINATTGALSFVGAAPDFETPADAGANNVYDVIVRAADNLGASDTQAIAVTITNTAGATQTGTTGGNSMTGGNEEDNLSGGAGSDVISGNGGNDVLNGGTSSDIVNGGAGNDRLTGGADLDLLTGGAGNDTFIYTMTGDSGTNLLTRDIISDFTKGQDRIDLSGIDANISLAGDQGFTFLATQGAAFTGTGLAQVRYYYANLLGIQYTVIEASIDGDRNPEFSVALNGYVALTASDFIL